MEMAEKQKSCPDVKKMQESVSLKVQQMEVSGSTLWCDTSAAMLRPLVPVALRKKVFLAVHGLAHLGIRASKRMVASRFVWTGLASDVTEWCRV